MQINWRRLKDHGISRAIPYWGAAIVVGLLSTGYTNLFSEVSKWSHDFYAQHPLLLFIFGPCCFLIGWALVRYFAPSAGGSGIPQVLAAIELDPEKDKSRIERLLSLRILVVKVVSSLFCLLGGGAIGREGPTLQISASLFHLFGQKSRKFWRESDHKSWVVAGGAAGIASAFNTPLGGIVYAIEELSSAHFQKFRTVALSAVIIAGVTAQAILGPYLYLGYPKVESFGFGVLPVALLVGLISGSMGSVFGKVLFATSSLVQKIVPESKKMLIPLLCGIGLALIYTFVNHDAIGSGGEINSRLLFSGADHSSISLIGARFASTIISYVSGCAGGIFAPSLAMGASIGAELSRFIGTEFAILSVLMGMAGFLSGVTHCPFTSIVLILEMTDHHSAIFPLMVSALVAHAVARSFDRISFYEKVKLTYLKLS